MLRTVSTDIVCISTPPTWHERGVDLALDLPLQGILVEKPQGHCHASGTAILDSIRDRNLPVTDCKWRLKPSPSCRPGPVSAS